MDVYVIIFIGYLISVILAYVAIKKDWANYGWRFKSPLLIFVLIPFFNLGATYAAIRSIRKFNKQL